MINGNNSNLNKTKNKVPNKPNTKAKTANIAIKIKAKGARTKAIITNIIFRLIINNIMAIKTSIETLRD